LQSRLSVVSFVEHCPTITLCGGVHFNALSRDLVKHGLVLLLFSQGCRFTDGLDLASFIDACSDVFEHSLTWRFCCQALHFAFKALIHFRPCDS
jgi:hypothetical protein